MTKYIDVDDHADRLLLAIVGGANEIGVNCYCYCYKGKILVVDCGSGFAGDQMPGVDMMVPDYSFLLRNRDRLVGIVITHVHEDHIGSLHVILEELECKVYATNFATNFLKYRLAESSFNEIDIEQITPGGILNLGPFLVEALPLSHSAPEMQGFIIKTDVGDVFHTGDWKMDPPETQPILANDDQTEMAKLQEYGRRGILAMVCDSTNVFNEGHSSSERALRESLVDIINGINGLVVVGTFASNVARIDSIAHAARKAGRRVAVSGKSLYRMVNAAHESGYLKDIDLIDESEIENYPRNQVLIIATGCQGEPLAAVSKMAMGEHRYVRLAEGDTMIFSSKIIPGNEKRIFTLFNIFVHRKINVITEREHFVHASGHGYIEELTKMYQAMNPHIAVPVHGEPFLIHEHVQLAKRCGVKHSIEVRNGDVVELCKDNPRIVGKIETGYYGVDGKCLVHIDSNIFKMRKKFRDAGVVVANVVMDKRSNLLTRPSLDFPGCLDYETDRQLIDSVRKTVLKSLNQMLGDKKGNCSNDEIEAIVKTSIRRALKPTGKYPIILFNLERITIQQ